MIVKYFVVLISNYHLKQLKIIPTYFNIITSAFGSTNIFEIFTTLIRCYLTYDIKAPTAHKSLAHWSES